MSAFEEAFDPNVFDLDTFDTTETAEFDAGYLRIYSGSQPASVAVAISSQVLLAELIFRNPAFAPSTGDEVLTANLIIGDGEANAEGIATFFRIVRDDGTTVVADGSVGRTSGDLRLNTTSIARGAHLTAAVFTYDDGDLAGTGLVLPAKPRPRWNP